MFQRAITLEQFSDIHERLEVLSLTRSSGLWITVGEHPDLGSICVLQDIEPDLILLSEAAPTGVGQA